MFFSFLVIVQEKEVLFNYVVEEYISSRRQHLVRLFLDALTVGGPGGTPRPIEMHAHEPTRSEEIPSYFQPVFQMSGKPHQLKRDVQL